MPLYTTKAGTEYVLGKKGRYAYPKRGPGTFPRDLWGHEAAAARGELVDALAPRDDYRVRAAGADWLEVYEHLRSLAGAGK